MSKLVRPRLTLKYIHVKLIQWHFKGCGWFLLQKNNEFAFKHIKKDKHIEKSRKRETLNLSTDADSSTDTTVGWTKNTQKPKKNKNSKNNPKRKNSKTSRDMLKLAIYPSTRGI